MSRDFRPVIFSLKHIIWAHLKKNQFHKRFSFAKIFYCKVQIPCVCIFNDYTDSEFSFSYPPTSVHVIVVSHQLLVNGDMEMEIVFFYHYVYYFEK